MILSVAAMLALGAALSMPQIAEAQAPDECRELDRVIYTEIGPSWGTLGLDDGVERLRISDIGSRAPDSPSLSGSERHPSPQGTAFFVQQRPDTTEPGPWDTVVYVYGNQVRPLGVRIEVLGHASYGVNARWINEKLLFLEVWLGRIAAADLVVDVESASLVSAESANHGRLILSCEEKRRFR